MYDLIAQIIDHSWTTGDSAQQYIFYTCVIIISITYCVLIDLIYRILRHFWHS